MARRRRTDKRVGGTPGTGSKAYTRWANNIVIYNGNGNQYVTARFVGDSTVIVNGDGYSEVHAEGGGQTVIIPATPDAMGLLPGVSLSSGGAPTREIELQTSRTSPFGNGAVRRGAWATIAS